MKIAYFMDRSDSLGGAGHLLLKHALISKRKGISYVVIIPKQYECSLQSPVIEKCREYELEYKELPYSTAFDFSGIDILDVLKNVESMVRFISEYKINLLHSVQINLTVEFAARKLEIAHLMSIYSIEEEAFDISLPQILPNYVHSDSRMYASLWNKKIGAYSTCIRPWIPQDIFEEKTFFLKRSSNNLICILVIGIISEHKGQLKVIELIHRLIKTGINVKLNLCGDFDNKNSYYNQCVNYIQANNIEEYVYFTGYTNKVNTYLENADVVICASNRESCPQAVLESMAMKVPVIATPIAGIPELIEDEDSGYLSKGFSVDELEEAFRRWHNDYIHMKDGRIIENAYQTFVKECSFECVSNKLFDFYAYILKDGKIGRLEEFDILIDGVKEFTKILSQNKMKLLNYEYIRSHIFYITYLYRHISSKFNGNRTIKVAIWGASKGGEKVKEIVDVFYTNVSIVLYIDRYKTGSIDEVPVISKERIELEEIDFVLIATQPGKEEAISYLNKNGFMGKYAVLL